MSVDTPLPQDSLEEWDCRKLVRNIGRGKCVLLLGPEAASGPAGEPAQPLTVLLARRLAAKLPGLPSQIDQDNLPQVAQFYLAQKDRDRADLEMDAEDYYRPYRGLTTVLHRRLAALPFRLCVTTTPDDFLTTAFRDAGKEPQRAFYHFRSGQVSHLQSPTVACPLIYKLYGDFGGNDSSSLVLTETDLLDFLVNVISRQPELPSELLRQFADPDTSFLFVGFGFQQWHLRILLHVLRRERPKSRSLALEDPEFFRDPDGPRITWFFDQTQAIEFKQCSWAAFGEALSRYYQSHEPGEPTSIAEPPPDAPRVFLCHCSEDSEQVEALGLKLRALGLNTWRDRENLRGGDQWDRVLEHVLKNQVDYVLVLQTPAMLRRVEGYFYKEIKIALDRQKDVGEGFRFIFPAFLGDSAGQKLSELAHLQYRDLTGGDEITRLVEDISADQEQRRRRAAA